MKRNKTRMLIGLLAVTGLWLPMADGCHKHARAFAAENTDQKAKPYPLDKCVVSDEKLGTHGQPYAFTANGQEVKLCCKDCLKDFEKDKAKYMKKIEAASKKQPLENGSGGGSNRPANQAVR
jgi:hypothetical protein